MYLHPGRLVDAGLTHELAEQATPPGFRPVADELLAAVLREQDTSAWSTDEVALAQRARGVVVDALQAADALIDGYLKLRKPHPLPLDPVPDLVGVWARWIARYLLHKDRMSSRESADPVVRDYESALRFLADTRDGKFSLGADDVLPPAGAGTSAFSAPERRFTMDSLRDF